MRYLCVLLSFPDLVPHFGMRTNALTLVVELSFTFIRKYRYMSDQTSIFGNQSNQSQVTPEQQASQGGAATTTTQTNDPYTDLLKTITNESGAPKYASIPDALKGLQNAQSFISTLMTEKKTVEQQLQELRDENERLKTVESVVERLTQKQAVTEQTTQTVQTLDESKIAELVARTISQEKSKETMQSNVTKVAQTLQSVLGTDAESKFYGKASELGMSKEEINALAAKNPKATLALFGISDSPQQQAKPFNPVSSSVNTSAFQPTQDSFVRKNDKPILLGATTHDLINERQNAVKMVEELEANGLSIDDLTNPKNFFKIFK